MLLLTPAARLFFWQINDGFELNFRLDVQIEISKKKKRQKSQLKDSKSSHNRGTI